MYKWNEEKNAILKSTRGFSFEEVVAIMSEEGVLDNYKHPDQYIYEELEILEAIESDKITSVDFDNEEIKKLSKETLAYLKQKKQISINMKQSDLDFIRQRANDIGISYQNIIQALVHNYATGKLKLTI